MSRSGGGGAVNIAIGRMSGCALTANISQRAKHEKYAPARHRSAFGPCGHVLSAAETSRICADRKDGPAGAGAFPLLPFSYFLFLYRAQAAAVARLSI